MSSELRHRPSAQPEAGKESENTSQTKDSSIDDPRGESKKAQDDVDQAMVLYETREGLVVGLGLFLLALYIFSKTMYPTLPGGDCCFWFETHSFAIITGDSGELIVAAYNLGLPHPPGYPLFTLIGYAFTHWLPESWGSVAYRCNLVSVVCTAGAGGVTFHTIQRLLLELFPPRKGGSSTGSAWIAFFGAGLFSFFPLIWLYALQVLFFDSFYVFITIADDRRRCLA